MNLQKTKGIVLNQFKYSETSIIVNILTEDFGKMSFIVNGVRKKKSKFPANYFQAFNIIHLVFIQSSKSDLHRIIEINNITLLEQIIFNLHKSSVCMFLAEIIHLSYNSSEKDKKLYQFLENIIQFIDSTPTTEIVNIHLWTLLRLMQFSGIAPENNYSEEKPYFDALNGSFTDNKNKNRDIYNLKHSNTISLLLSSKVEDNSKIKINRVERQELLNLMIHYFQIHLNTFKTSRSLDILSEIFED